MRVACEQRVMLGECGLHFLVRWQRLALRQLELARRLALGERPVRDAVLGDEARSGLRDANPVLRVTHAKDLGTRSAFHDVRTAGRGRPASCGRVPSARDRRCDRRQGETRRRRTRSRCSRRRAGPLSGFTRTLIRPSGGGRGFSGTPFSAFCMKLIQMGSAAIPPVSLAPSERGWSKPIHDTPTIEALKPQNQASTFSLVVPVLPARSLRPSDSARVAVPSVHDVAQHRRHHERIARVDRALGRLARDDRLCLGQHVALGIGHAAR